MLQNLLPKLSGSDFIPLEPYIPQSAHIDERTVVTKSGDVMRFYRVDGIEFETIDGLDALTHKLNLNNCIRGISDGQVALYQHTMRVPVELHPTSGFTDDRAQDIDRRYIESLNRKGMMETVLFLTVVYRPTVRKSIKLLTRIGRRSTAEIERDNQLAAGRLRDVCMQVESTLSDYGLTPLESDGEFSEPMSFLNALLTGMWTKIRLSEESISGVIGGSVIRPGSEVIEIRSATDIDYVQMVEILDYKAKTTPGCLDGLLYLPFRAIVTQSFSTLSRAEGEETLIRQMEYLEKSEDRSPTQVNQLKQAIDMYVDGQYAMGEYGFSVAVYGSSIEEVQENTKEVISILTDSGFIAMLSTLSCESQFFAQLPGNFYERGRLAYLTSKNYASLACLHGFGRGKANGNPWGECLTYLQTSSGQPFAFNLHVATNPENQEGVKLIGNTRIIGKAGTGKSSLLHFLIDQMQKYDVTSLTFDKNFSGRVATLARGGLYLSIEKGRPTGINPFQWEPNESTRDFLMQLVLWLIHSDGSGLIAAEDRTRVSEGISSVLRLPKELRRLSTLLQNIAEPTGRSNGLIDRLAPWCYDDGHGRVGEYAWVVDNPVDSFELTGASNIGIDCSSFLKDQTVRTPITMMILQKARSLMDGRRFNINFEEAQALLDDPALCAFAGDEQETIRKKDGFCIFLSPTPSSILESAVSSQLREQIATEIYLPNPKASKHEYCAGFGLTDSEFALLKSQDEQSRVMLVKQGTRSYLARLDLSPFQDLMAIYSASAESNEAADKAIELMGDKPADWLPEYCRLMGVSQ